MIIIKQNIDEKFKFFNLISFNNEEHKSLLFEHIINKYGHNCIIYNNLELNIHFLNLHNYISNILTKCLNENKILFATTYSKECIEVYTEVINELGLNFQDKSCFIRIENLFDILIARSYNYEQLSSSIELGNEVRI